MSKNKSNRRKTARAHKRARMKASERRFPPQMIVWACDDPACVEGIHHLDDASTETPPERERPRAANSGPFSDSSEMQFGGAFHAHGTHN